MIRNCLFQLVGVTEHSSMIVGSTAVWGPNMAVLKKLLLLPFRSDEALLHDFRDIS